MERMRLTGVCRLALLLLFPLWLSAAASPSYTIETIPNVRLADRNNYVSNPDGIIRSDDAARINSLLRTVEDSLGIEIAVVAVKSIGDNDARMFATDLFQYWKPGKKGKDNGLLIQLVTLRSVPSSSRQATGSKASSPMPSATACNSATCSPTSKPATIARECRKASRPSKTT